MEIIREEYKSFLANIKSKIQSAQLKAHIKVNVELLNLYWDIAQLIVEKQKQSSWGDKVLESISKDLKKEFPNMSGFSIRNIHYMKKWFLFYAIVQQPVAQIFQIPWGHNIHIISKAKSIDEALFYVNMTLQNNYSRASLVQETLKDPYNFDFLNLRKSHDEKELEDALMENMTKFLLELGQGFSFLGRQYKIVVDNSDFKMDLLFYHVKLHCYVVVELKVTDFKPEYAGKINFYVSAVDAELKSELDNPTIGILICKSKSDTIVEYALKNLTTPIGVSEYELTEVLPKEYKSSLPTVEEIEAEFRGIEYE